MQQVHVTVTKIIGTKRFYYTAYRECERAYRGYSSFQTIDGKCCGRVGTEELPDWIAFQKPHSDERLKAVRAWHADRYQEAYTAILAVHPDAAGGSREMGEIVVDNG